MRDQLNCQPRCSAVGSVRAQTSRCVVADQEGYHLPACAGAQLRPYRPAHGGGSDNAPQDIGQRNGLSYPVRRYPNRVSIRKILNSRTPAWSGLVSGGETGDRGVCPPGCLTRRCVDDIPTINPARQLAENLLARAASCSASSWMSLSRRHARPETSGHDATTRPVQGARSS
jgi:hypothetical protein